ncbi:MAG: AAA family ATPase, partial [Oscillospiraceae bacterium]|nr:AAA family ATPase [Oscillospiraceae bacterium]
TFEESADINSLREFICSRLNATLDADVQTPFIELVRRFELDEFSTFCLLLAFVATHERKYEKIFIYLQDDITKKHPLAETAIDILAVPGENLSVYYPYFLPSSPLRRFLLSESATGDSLRVPLILHPRILDYLLGGGYGENLPGYLTRQEDMELHDICGDLNLSERISEVITSEYGKTNVVCVTGNAGTGRRFHIAHALVKSTGKHALFVDIRTVLEQEGELESKTLDIIREGALYAGHLCFWHFESLMEQPRELQGFIEALSRSSGLLRGAFFLVTEKQWNEPGLPSSFLKVDIDVSDPQQDMQLKLWNFFSKDVPMSEEIDLGELTTKFNFTPLQIKNSIRKADGLRTTYRLSSVNADILYPSCYEQIKINLDTLAMRVLPAHSWDDLVLPEGQIKLLRDACAHVRYKHKVYHEWGYAKKVTYGRGLSILFSGPPGTGKTLAAQIVAGHLHMEMYKIQLSAIVSKYIGETEKNLRNVFQEAKDSGCILFFDETDALFGKRSEVKDSHDRHANVETAFLLQQLEEYDGVIIMGTNLLQNIDNAFMRRINFVIHFPFPEADVRETLWRKMVLPTAPVSDDIDFEFLAERFSISGGNIKNIVLHAAFMAAAVGEPIDMRHLLRSAVGELRKTNTIVSREDMREYADIIFT